MWKFGWTRMDSPKPLIISTPGRDLREQLNWGLRLGLANLGEAGGPGGVCAPPMVEVAKTVGHWYYTFIVLLFTHFGDIQEADFQYANIFWPNYFPMWAFEVSYGYFFSEICLSPRCGPTLVPELLTYTLFSFPCTAFTTQDAYFRYALIFWPNYMEYLKIKWILIFAFSYGYF